MGDPHAATTPTPVARGLISRMVAPAIELWLKSQVERVEQLQVTIQAGNRQLLSGTIPQLTLLAQNAVYQGLHLSAIDLTGQNIRVNLNQVVQGKPLQLLEPIAVNGTIVLQEADLNTSLAAPLLANAVKLFLLDLLRSNNLDAITEDGDLNLQNLQLRLFPDRLTLKADLISQSGQATEIAIRSGLRLTQPNQLQLHQPQWLPHFNAKRGLPLQELDGYPFDLGETQLSELTIGADRITCIGQLLVQP
jgi:LmeA-like phospholipid-binding